MTSVIAVLSVEGGISEWYTVRRKTSFEANTMKSRYYLLKEKLQEVATDPFWENQGTGSVTVALTSMEDFVQKTTLYGMGLDFDLGYDSENIRTTKAIVNFDSLTGSFSIPNRADIFGQENNFLFAVRDNGIVFIDDDGTAQKIIDRIQKTKKWRSVSLERFIYDFLETIISGDLKLLESYEVEMDKMEDLIEKDADDEELEELMPRLADIRSALQTLRIHYQQLSDLAHEFEENENGYFKEENLRFFRMFIERVERLEGFVSALRDHTMQVRDLYQSHLAEKQNRIVTILTIVTTIAVPLTFITGWYGMNFVYMPELSKPWAYPAVIVFCLALSGLFIWLFKKKKWL